MGPEILSLEGGFPSLPGPLERSSTVCRISLLLRTAPAITPQYDAAVFPLGHYVKLFGLRSNVVCMYVINVCMYYRNLRNRR